MNIITNAPKGTRDILPSESYKWQIVEDVARRIAVSYGYEEIRTPLFEHTNLFCRSVGEDTDVVQKEMYTFLDKGKRSITLRPEGTASAARAMLENGLHNGVLPIKTYYFDSCYRYEKPQAGRLREFHQFGIELFGASSPAADAEIICFANSFFESLGILDLSLEINSIGCPKCRATYHKALIEYFSKYIDSLCPLCRERLNKNPLRVLDCKNDSCKKIAIDAPKILDYLCDECKSHFKSVRDLLDSAGIEYIVNPNIVRGLDYYTKTVFEFIDKTTSGQQNTVCGGGRYDGLVEELGGPHMPSLGFGLGLERLLAMLDKDDSAISQVNRPTCDLYIASLGEKSKQLAFKLTELIRTTSLNAQTDLNDKSLKAQMKYADKINAKYSLVVGENEIENKKAIIKNMMNKETYEINLTDSFCDEFIKIYNNNQNEFLDL